MENAELGASPTTLLSGARMRRARGSETSRRAEIAPTIILQFPISIFHFARAAGVLRHRVS